VAAAAGRIPRTHDGAAVPRDSAGWHAFLSALNYAHARARIRERMRRCDLLCHVVVDVHCLGGPARRADTAAL
jgi:hypothetical protein